MKWRGLEESGTVQPASTLTQELEARKTLAEKYVPPATQAINRRTVEQLAASGMMGGILPIGAQAPSFELPDQDGDPVSSASLLERGRVVICFFRGRWCPFCVAQLEAMDRVLGRIAHAGASLIGVSPQTQKQSFFMRDQHKFGFPLLSDAHNQVARHFGLVYRVPEEQQSIYSRSFTNLPMINGDASWELPVPATFILRRNGRVAYVSANPDYTSRPEPAEVLRELAAI
jgi:peroxiredoxin